MALSRVARKSAFLASHKLRDPVTSQLLAIVEGHVHAAHEPCCIPNNYPGFGRE